MESKPPSLTPSIDNVICQAIEAHAAHVAKCRDRLRKKWIFLKRTGAGVYTALSLFVFADHSEAASFRRHLTAVSMKKSAGLYVLERSLAL